MPAGGLEVAVISDHPGPPQAAELRLRQQPVGGAGSRAPLVPYPAVRPAQGFRLPVGQRPDTETYPLLEADELARRAAASSSG